MPDCQLLHGTCIAHGGHGVLLRGPSGAGKSDLALRCLHHSFPGRDGRQLWQLVSDDQTLLCAENDCLIARPAPEIAGKLEVRGIGIIDQEYVPCTNLKLILDLVAPGCDAGKIERLPPDLVFDTILGVDIALMPLAPFEISAPIKVNLALRRVLEHRTQ